MKLKYRIRHIKQIQIHVHLALPAETNFPIKHGIRYNLICEEYPGILHVFLTANTKQFHRNYSYFIPSLIRL